MWRVKRVLFTRHRTNTLLFNQTCSTIVFPFFFLLIHSANPKSWPVGIIVFAHVVRPSVRPHISNLEKHNNRKQFSLLAWLWVWPSGSLMTPVLCLSNMRHMWSTRLNERKKKISILDSIFEIASWERDDGWFQYEILKHYKKYTINKNIHIQPCNFHLYLKYYHSIYKHTPITFTYSI